MHPQDPLKDKAILFKLLGERLATCPEVTKHDDVDHKEAWTLAHSFLDLEDSFRKFLDEQLPKLVGGQIQASEICNLLDDIGEELRHILYHIKAPKFYLYLHEDDKR